MKALHMDFIQSHSTRAYLFILLVSVPLLSFAIHDRARLMDEIDENQLRVGSLKEKLHKLEVRPSSPHSEPEAVKVIKGMMAVPWDTALGALQQATDNDILLDKLQSSANKQFIVSGRASTSEAFVSYLGRLAETGAFKEIIPVSQQQDVLSGGQPTSAITFEIALAWM